MKTDGFIIAEAAELPKATFSSSHVPPYLSTPFSWVFCVPVMLVALLLFKRGLALRPRLLPLAPSDWRLACLVFVALAAGIFSEWLYPPFISLLSDTSQAVHPAIPWLFAAALSVALFCLIRSFNSQSRRIP